MKQKIDCRQNNIFLIIIFLNNIFFLVMEVKEWENYKMSLTLTIVMEHD